VGRPWLCGTGAIVAALVLAACGGGAGRPSATRPAAPALARTAGAGSTGVVLAHESPGGLCGRLPVVPTFTAHGLGVLAFDFRAFAPSASAPNRNADDFAPDLQAPVDALHLEGADKVFVVGASFGGAVTLAEGARLHGLPAS
jgi:alpha-beta hydrolase superfamily lysophospholipase